MRRTQLAAPVLGQGRDVSGQSLQHLLQGVHVRLGEALRVELQAPCVSAALGDLLRREGTQRLPQSGQVALQGKQTCSGDAVERHEPSTLQIRQASSGPLHH